MIYVLLLIEMCLAVAAQLVLRHGAKMLENEELGLGIVLSGCANAAIAVASALPVISSLWAANGFFQGFGGPACVSLLTRWFPAAERGKWCAAARYSRVARLTTGL